jgi:hypothetical protein
MMFSRNSYHVALVHDYFAWRESWDNNDIERLNIANGKTFTLREVLGGGVIIDIDDGPEHIFYPLKTYRVYYGTTVITNIQLDDEYMSGAEENTSGTEEVRQYGVVKYYPFVRAYAMTIHKSQGLTLPVAAIDLRSPFLNTSLVYVAISRCRTPEGVFIIDWDYPAQGVSKSVSTFYSWLYATPRSPYSITKTLSFPSWYQSNKLSRKRKVPQFEIIKQRCGIYDISFNEEVHSNIHGKDAAVRLIHTKLDPRPTKKRTRELIDEQLKTTPHK